MSTLINLPENVLQNIRNYVKTTIVPLVEISNSQGFTSLDLTITGEGIFYRKYLHDIIKEFFVDSTVIVEKYYRLKKLHHLQIKITWSLNYHEKHKNIGCFKRFCNIFK